MKREHFVKDCLRTCWIMIATLLCGEIKESQAALISWQPSVDLFQGTTTEAFVNNAATYGPNAQFVVAANGSNGGNSGRIPLGDTLTVNGVDFVNADNAAFDTGITNNGVTLSTSGTQGSNSGAFGDGGFTGDLEIFDLISTGTFNPTTVTFSGLTIGELYAIQVITNDARTNGGRDSDFQSGFTDGVNGITDSIANGTFGTSSLNNRDPATLTGETSGDSITGFFIADAATQSFNIFGSNNGFTGTNPANSGGRAQINAISLFIVPEPSSLALLLVGIVSTLSLRRRRVIS